MNGLDVLCAQLTRDLFAIAKFFLYTFHLKFTINADSDYEHLLIETEFNMFTPSMSRHGQSFRQLVCQPFIMP